MSVNSNPGGGSVPKVHLTSLTPLKLILLAIAEAHPWALLISIWSLFWFNDQNEIPLRIPLLKLNVVGSVAVEYNITLVGEIPPSAIKTLEFVISIETGIRIITQASGGPSNIKLEEDRRNFWPPVSTSIMFMPELKFIVTVEPSIFPSSVPADCLTSFMIPPVRSNVPVAPNPSITSLAPPAPNKSSMVAVKSQLPSNPAPPIVIAGTAGVTGDVQLVPSNSLG